MLPAKMPAIKNQLRNVADDVWSRDGNLSQTLEMVRKHNLAVEKLGRISGYDDGKLRWIRL
jgi:hypothetical protein